MSYDPSIAVRQTLEIGEFPLESGAVIHDCRISYLVHGQPKGGGENVILLTSSLGGDAHRLDFMIGGGLAFDPDEICVIAIDALGNGHSSSSSNSPRQAGMSFPQYSIRDMVQSQRRVLKDVFGLEKILAVAGASMGGMQALQWAVSYPEAMHAIIALVPLAKTPPWTAVMNEASRRTIMADPTWNGGEYDNCDFAGWRAAMALTQVISARSPDSVNLDVGPRSPISWLDHLTEDAIHRFDPNDWITQSRAYDAHDLGTTPGFDGDTDAALASISVPTLIIGVELDLLNPASNQELVADGIASARFVLIPSQRGHMASNTGDEADVAFINREVVAFLKNCRQTSSYTKNNRII